MGSVFKKILDPAGFVQGQKDMKKAAQEQADATRAAANMSARQANFQAEAAAQQMSQAQEQRTQQQYAQDLLSKPMESAQVDLADTEDDREDDLLTRRRTTRQSYQKPGRSGLAV